MVTKLDPCKLIQIFIHFVDFFLISFLKLRPLRLESRGQKIVFHSERFRRKVYLFGLKKKHITYFSETPSFKPTKLDKNRYFLDCFHFFDLIFETNSC